MANLRLVRCIFGEETDIFNSAIALGIVHAVADDELVGDFESDIVGFDRNEAPFRFVETGGDFERGWFVLEHQAAKIAEGEASIENIFDEDDMFAFDRVIDVFDELYRSGRDARAAVTRYGYKVEGIVDVDRAG